MAAMPAVSVDVNKLPLDGEGGLVEVLREMTDPRKARGIRHPIENVLALAVMAALSGMRSYEATAEWAKELPKDVLRRMKCWCWRAPSEPTFRRVLQMVDADEVDRRVNAWLMGLAESGAVSLDGKTLRGSTDGQRPAMHLLSAITHGQGVVVAQSQVGEKSNEIPGAKPLLEPLDLRGVTVSADAMHTQTDLARFLVEEKQADYVFVAKDNQPTLRADIEALEWESFSPSGQDARQGARPSRGAHDPAER
jgi:predicted transposase YbfD/YdcC